MTQRFFTPHSAREALDRMRPTVERMCRLYTAMQGRKPKSIQCDQRVADDYFTMLTSLHGDIDSIHRQGAHVKDLRRGLLDFPARRQGRPVLLCWRVGETSLEFWHETEAGYAGRQRVTDDGLWDDA